MFLERVHYSGGNLVEVARRECKDRWASAREADTQQTRLGSRVHGVQDIRQTGHEMFAVWLVDLVLHGKVDHIWVKRGSTESGREEGGTLQVVNLVTSLLAQK
jgi:hypothetical protein